MFCDRCGTSLTDTQAYCPSCGKATNAGPPPPVLAPAPPPQNRVAGHVKSLGICWLLYSAFDLMGGWFLSSVFPRFFDAWGWFPHFPFLVGGFLRAVGWLLAVRGVLGLIAGWGLLDRQPWARMLAIVLGVLSLPRLLLGTALGIYTLWVLLPGESERDYRQMARAA